MSTKALTVLGKWLNWKTGQKQKKHAMWQHSTRFKAIRVPLKMHIHTEVIFLAFKKESWAHLIK